MNLSFPTLRAPAWAAALIFVLGAACASTPPVAPTPPPSAAHLSIGGYYDGSNVYKRDYQVADIPVPTLTTVFYAFLRVADDSTLDFFDKNADIVKKSATDPAGLGYRGNFAQLRALKADHPRVKVIASVGGGAASDKFADLAADPARRKTFAASAAAFLTKYAFDGLDIDWEFPKTPDQGKGLTLLLQDLRAAFDKASPDRRLDLGVAVSPNPAQAKNLDLKALGKVCDFVNLMTYDYHGAWDKQAFHLAPLYANPDDPGYRWAAGRKLNVAGAVTYFLEGGVPASKLHLGLPSYGFGWQLAPGLAKPLFAPAVEKTTLKDTGILEYREIQRLIAGGLKPRWDEASRAPYLYDPDTGLFVTYDDGRSVTEKVELALQKGLGGVFFWELSKDPGADLVNFTAWTLSRGGRP